MEYTTIGVSVGRTDGPEKVAGAAVYTADLDLPGLATGKLLRSTLPHARLVKVDVEDARRLPGVLGILTPEDVAALPHPTYGPFLSDQPVLALEKVRFVGEPVVALAAEDEDTAQAALDLIRVEYAELPVVLTIDDALAPGAPILHDARSWPDVVWTDLKSSEYRPGTNTCSVFHLRKADVDGGLASADVVIETTTRVPVVQHAHMEPHATIASWDRAGKLTVWSSTQNPSVIRAQLAQIFAIPHSRVRVIAPYVGGGYGAKAHPRLEPVVSALARKVGRPVRVVLSREEVFLTVTRHAATVTIKSGVARDGTIVARTVDARYDTGAYADSGPRTAKNGGYAAPGPYRIPSVRVESSAIYTNKVPAGPFRGFGVPQVAWNFEQHMDELAATLGMDALEFRLKNIVGEGDEIATGERLHAANVRECLVRCAEAIGWTRHPAGASRARPLPARTARGKGLSCHIKSTFTPSLSIASGRMNEDGSVVVHAGTVEIGQGARTILAQIVGEELAVPFDRIEVVLSDTDVTPYDQSTTSSRSTFSMGNAVRGVAVDIKRQLAELAAQQLEAAPEDLTFRDGAVSVKGSPGRRLAYAAVIRERFGAGLGALLGRSTFRTEGGILDPVTGQGKASAFWFAGACGADVDVDVETGVVTVRKLAMAVDAGRAIHPLNCHMQNEGSMMMGLGTALYEELVFDNGQPTNPTFLDYGTPTFMEMPGQFESILVETPHREGPFGAKGVGEVGLPSVAPSVGNAIADALGVRITELPITPERVLRAISARRQRETPR
ncbi:MAG TPA: molybdopterin cofactor-binding domain-containing protein [Candidatus Methylomirabilis sp.]|nr:molybdopterin cofactor-binding domain-containing protein [Candidatus Methylomirabilis sp.]